MSPKKPYSIAVVFGRFNLLHRGHIALFESMHEQADLIIVGVSTNGKNLPSKDRWRVIGKACDDLDINYRVNTASQPFELFEFVSHIAEGPVLTMFGEDQYKLGKAAQRVYGWDTDVIPRLTSSTAIRGLIDNEEWDVLARLVPSSIINDVINLRKQETNG